MAQNLLDPRNSTFDPSWGQGTRQLPEGNIFIPDGWDLGWLADVPFAGIHNEPAGLVAHRPEAVSINQWQGLEPELTPDFSYALKVFVQNPLYAWLLLNAPIALPAGDYVFRAKVWPKLHLNGVPGNPHPTDPWAAEIGLQLVDDGTIDWRNGLDYAAYNVLEWRFTHAGGPFNFRLHFKGKYPIDNTFFFHWVRLEEVGGAPEPGTGGNSNGVVELGPLTLALLSRIAVAAESLAAHFSGGEPEPPEPEPATLTVWSQRDPRWADQVYAGGATLGASGCLVCAAASIASQVLHPAPTPPEFARDLRDVGAFAGALLSNPARIPLAYPALEWGGAVHWRTVPADLVLLQRELDAHGPVICEVKWNPDGPSPEQGNQHFVVVERLLRDTAGDITDAVIADPWDGERRLLSASRYRKPGWSVARTLYGARLLRPAGAAPATPTSLRGVHGAPTYNPPADIPGWVARLQALGVRWYKLLDAGSDANDGFIRSLATAGITPVVRLYQGRQFPGRLAPPLLARLQRLAGLGVTYVEIGNEPNLIGEWSTGTPDYHNADQVAQVAASWWQDAHAALEAGLSPALYALAPTERNYGTHPTASSIGWQYALLTALKRYGESEMRSLLSSGRVWLAVHTADFGRDFDYPWRTTAGVDDMCLLGYKAHRATVEEVFGVRPTIIATEGGVYSPEHLAALTFMPTYSEAQWGPRLRDMYAFLEQQGDMLAMCSWTFSDEGAPEEWHNCGWYHADGAARSPVTALQL